MGQEWVLPYFQWGEFWPNDASGVRVFSTGVKNRPFLGKFSTGVASGVDPTGSQRQGCFLTQYI